MNHRVKKGIFITLNLLIAVYLVMAMVSFNNPKETYPICTKVSINIEDESTNGFLSAKEVKQILEKKRLYPFKKKMADINPRDIEDLLKVSPFVKTAQCYKTKDGYVCINLTQRLPIIRIKNSRGEDYYLDDHGGIMPNSKYTSDLIIATGNINRAYAKNYLAYFAIELMKDEFWKNQIVQINILPDMGIEIVPRVGDHIVCLGSLPQTKNENKRKELIAAFVNKKMTRLKKFYKYGLSQVGWNKYSYIDIEFDNQIICKKRNKTEI
ncbi:MAG: cell division protein FtsQ [Prevotellaceae bacterium]|nr:cell division protein FtsQ [Prevotellaceae bacterium]